jgi:dienelactone hydrolase
MARFLTLSLLWLYPLLAAGQGTPSDLQLGSKFAAIDSLACGDESTEDAKECLTNLSWAPANFTVSVEAAEPGFGDWLVRFPSARPIGNSANDLVAMEWYAARDKDGAIRQARAVVVIHESGRRMTVGRLIARGLSWQGLHAFLLHLPGYGARHFEGQSELDRALPALQQAIADARRARDAVSALPLIDHSVIGVEGTSLGGFVTATVAGLDRGYDRVFILLAGGNLEEVVLHGAKDAAKTRAKLAAAGVTEDKIKQALRQVEPLRLAHRINPATTWLYSGKFDDVVPPRCSLALANAAHLSDGHHIELSADHYSGVIYLPHVVQQIAERMVQPLEAETPYPANHSPRDPSVKSP